MRKKKEHVLIATGQLQNSHSLFIFWTKKEKKLNKSSKENPKEIPKFFSNSVTPPLAEPEGFLQPQNHRSNQLQPLKKVKHQRGHIYVAETRSLCDRLLLTAWFCPSVL